MSFSIRILAIVAFAFFGSINSFAQTESHSTLYLKNGSIIRGTVMEIVPEKTVKIQTADGNIFVFSMAEVDRITGPSLEASDSSNGTIGMEEPNRVLFEVFGGAAVPMGDFADENGGGAKTGFVFGAECMSRGRLGWLVTFSYAQNSTTVPQVSGGSISMGNWSALHMMAGMHFGSDRAGGPNFYIAPLVGIAVGSSPEISIGSLTVNSSTATAFAYGAAFEIAASAHLCIGAKFITSKPTYTFSSTTPGVTISGSAQQSSSLLMIHLGFIL